MKPYTHAVISAKRYGGVPEDYIELHNFMDSSKACYPHIAHRAVLHSSFGIFIGEKVFGVTITNSEGKQISTRDVLEHHVHEDLGFIPTVEDWLQNLELKDWMQAKGKKDKTVIPNNID